MIKIAGLSLAFVAAAATGMMKASEIRRRRQLLEEFRDLIAHIATEISYFKEPLPQIFARLTSGDNRETSVLLRSVITSYRDGSAALSLQQMWDQGIDLVYEKSPLTAEDISVMKKCGQFLGQSDFRGQQDHFRLLDGQLVRQLSEAEDAIRTKGRMYSRLGVSVGLVIVIALI